MKWLLTILTLSLLASTGCAKKPPVVVLSDSNTLILQAGEPAPWSGWLLSDGAVVDLLEAADRCVED